MKAKTCASCSCRNASSIDTGLLMLSAAYNFVRANAAYLNKVKTNENDYYDVKIDEEKSGDNIVASVEKNVEDSAAVACMLNDETTSAGYAMMSKKKEFRNHAWAIYNTPSKPDSFGFCLTREEVIAIDEERENKW